MTKNDSSQPIMTDSSDDEKPNIIIDRRQAHGQTLSSVSQKDESGKDQDEAMGETGSEEDEDEDEDDQRYSITSLSGKQSASATEKNIDSEKGKDDIDDVMKESALSMLTSYDSGGDTDTELESSVNENDEKDNHKESNKMLKDQNVLDSSEVDIDSNNTTNNSGSNDANENKDSDNIETQISNNSSSSAKEEERLKVTDTTGVECEGQLEERSIDSNRKKSNEEDQDEEEGQDHDDELQTEDDEIDINDEKEEEDQDNESHTDNLKNDAYYEEALPSNIVLNPVSEWEEPIEVPSLTLFDMHRCPRKVNTDPAVRVALPLKVLTSEFQCPICLGYMKKTAIVMECLHRFCGECIQKCLRLGKKECPSCRIHIPTRRSLRPDPSFDHLIRKIYGDLDTLEEKVEKEIERMNKLKNMNNAYSESRKRGIMQQAKMRKKRQPSSRNNTEQSGATTTIPTNSETNPPPEEPSNQIASLVEESTLVAFFLRKHPHETLVDKLEREYIRTSRELTMRHLKLFLSRKLGYPISSHFQILVVAEGKGVILDDSVPLGDLKKYIQNAQDEETFLYYRVVSE